jgi:dihydropteroate synthase
LVDIGGVPFAPGQPVSVEQEIDRVVPVIVPYILIVMSGSL